MVWLGAMESSHLQDPNLDLFNNWTHLQLRECSPECRPNLLIIPSLRNGVVGHGAYSVVCTQLVSPRIRPRVLISLNQMIWSFGV
ncbi:hypothetical protein F3Y22_tig00117017pilonHSYRG00492 [Hibiscus syriacus]|uniref:Uncharacterized protein n=1 Tax=Hibiscus syriacus TaxID=106335 RepID=A0A6A2WP77_HIBSY|nr:hypothetical protein F3Y22_tig00117017pilonHSYRG00492 [Hibiscus syriacus]